MKKALLFIMIIGFCLPIIAQTPTGVGLSLAYLRDRWYSDADYLTKSINDIGGKLFIEDANGDADTQKEQILSLIQKGVKAIIIVPVDALSLNESIEACKKANIKVIAYDRLIKNCDIDFYISFNAEKVGELQASYIVNKIPQGNYILLAGPTKDNNSGAFLKGQKKVLEPFVTNKSINIVLEKNLLEWDRMEAFTEVSNIIDTGKGIDAIIASNDEIAAGAILAVEANEKFKNVLITGQDATLEACKDILAGKQILTIYKPIKLIAEATAKLAFALANGNTIEGITSKTDNGFKIVPTILLEPVLVDKGNLKETVIKDGFYTSQEIFGE